MKKFWSILLPILSLLMLTLSMFVPDHTEIVCLILAVVFYQYKLSNDIDDIRDKHYAAMNHLIEQHESFVKLVKGIDTEVQKAKERKAQEEQQVKQA